MKEESNQISKFVKRLTENEKRVLFADSGLKNALIKKIRKSTFEKNRTFLALCLKN